MSKGFGFEFEGELFIYDDECDPLFLKEEGGVEESLKEWLLDKGRIYNSKRLNISIFVS